MCCKCRLKSLNKRFTREQSTCLGDELPHCNENRQPCHTMRLPCFAADIGFLLDGGTVRCPQLDYLEHLYLNYWQGSSEQRSNNSSMDSVQADLWSCFVSAVPSTAQLFLFILWIFFSPFLLLFCGLPPTTFHLFFFSRFLHIWHSGQLCNFPFWFLVIVYHCAICALIYRCIFTHDNHHCAAIFRFFFNTMRWMML